MRRLESMRVFSGCVFLLALGMAVWSARPIFAQERAEVPWLGVMMQQLTPELTEGIRFRGEGVLVSDVMKESPAERAGIRKGDVIVSVNGRSVTSPDALSRQVRAARVGQLASLVVVRDGVRRTLSARLAARPDEADSEAWREDLHRELRKEIGDLRDLRGDLDIEVLRPRRGDGATMIFRGMGRGRMGVRVDDLNQDLAPYFNAPEASGALVMEVLKDTPAERAGIKAGDVITQVGDSKVRDADGLTRAVREAPEGKVTVALLRKGARRTVDVQLEAAPRAWRMQSGRDPVVVDPRRVTIRREAGDQDTMREELRELRQELKELRDRIERIQRRN